jgi:ABC-type uncharacterized transport system permease subunit
VINYIFIHIYNELIKDIGFFLVNLILMIHVINLLHLSKVNRNSNLRLNDTIHVNAHALLFNFII